MVDLDQFLNSLMASLARAKQSADLEGALIAEEYLRHPLLSGLNAPRIRMSDVEVDLPIAIVASTSDRPGPVVAPKEHATELVEGVERASARAGVKLTTEIRRELMQALEKNLQKLAEDWQGTGRGGLPVEVISRRAQETVREVLSPTRDSNASLSESGMRAVLSVVHERVLELTGTGERFPPGVQVKVVTDEIRELSPETVTRVRLVFKEESFEWESSWSESGIKNKLTRE